MAYDFLKKLYGTQNDGEATKAMTYAELEAAIDADKTIKVVDIKSGGYVAKETLDTKETELDGVKKQLEDANAEIQSYKDMDIDGIKKSAADWEEKYKTDTAALSKKLEDQATEFATKEYIGKFNFTSELARDAAIAAFMKQGFKRDENGKFLGADDFMASMKEANPGAFVVETPPAPEDTTPAPKPYFTPLNQATPPKGGKKMSLTEKMKYAAENPGIDINTLFE